MTDKILRAWTAGTRAASARRQRKLREWWPDLGRALDDLADSASPRTTMDHERDIRGTVAVTLHLLTAQREATPGKPEDGPYPASVPEVADEIAGYVIELDTSGAARGLRSLLIRRLLGDKGPMPQCTSTCMGEYCRHSAGHDGLHHDEHGGAWRD